MEYNQTGDKLAIGDIEGLIKIFKVCKDKSHSMELYQNV